jgi:hypothetical protein
VLSAALADRRARCAGGQCAIGMRMRKYENILAPQQRQENLTALISLEIPRLVRFAKSPL